MARFKTMGRKNGKSWRQPSGSLRIARWSDIELRQCSPHLCAICDFHGDIAMCDGPCHRQFHHVSIEGRKVENCPAVYIAPDKSGDPWLCPECKDQTYRCFQCGTVSTIARQCPQPFCVRFYCHECLPVDVEACPLHTCVACKEVYHDPHLAKVVQCLRCPRTWHRGCLAESQSHGFAPGRVAWRHRAHRQKRWMFYCPDHPIDSTLGTPVHDHISWL